MSIHRPSVYSSIDRSLRNDVHRVAEHIIGPQGETQPGVPRAPEQDWTNRRKAKPAEFLLPTTVRWMETLPSEFQPMVIVKAFPRIANTLAALWTRPDEFMSYVNDLLIDRRGGRQGFPNEVLTELHARTDYVFSARGSGE